MPETRRKLLIRIRRLCVVMMTAIVFLSVESLVTGDEVFQTYALGLGIFALVAVSMMIARTIRYDDTQ